MLHSARFAGDMTGKHSVYTIYEGHEIMFHVSTMLPYSKDNRQQVRGCSTSRKWGLNHFSSQSVALPVSAPLDQCIRLCRADRSTIAPVISFSHFCGCWYFGPATTP